MNGININIQGDAQFLLDFKKSDIYQEFIAKANSSPLIVKITEDTITNNASNVYTEQK